MLVELRENNLDAAKARAFKSLFASIVGKHTRVVLDMEGVGFVDSSGMSALIACLRDLRGRSGDLRVSSLAPPVRALFELMRMHRLFWIYPSAAEAVRSFE